MKFYLIGSFFLFALLARSCFAAVYISPTQGNDSTGDGTVGNPYLSLQKAISSAPAGSNIDILCQPGVYFYQNNSNLVITAGTVSISPTVTGVCEFLLYHSAGEVFFMNAIGPTASLVLTNLEITGGTSLSNGGLISATGGATVVAHFVTFANGTAVNYGGLVYLATSAGSSFSNCQFFHGVTTAVASAGGAVSAFNTDVTFLGCNFTSNSAERGGAVQISNQQGAINYAQSPTFTACSFLNNAVSPAAPNNAASSVSGGALQIDALPSSQSVQLISTNFDGNKAETSSGGGVFVGTGASATSNNCVFRNHKAHIGGAVYAETAEWVSTNTDYFANTATHINDETSGQGGAIAVHTGFLTLNGCLFESNTAGTNGGAVSHYGGAGHLSNPLPQDLTNITACNFVTNVATNGGGLYLFGLYNVISVAGTNWVQNRATGTGLQSGGGAIFASTAPVQVTYNSFENNTAEVGMGGGMYVALAAGSAVSDRSPSVATSTFQFNRAATGGGVCLDGLGNNTNGMAFLSSRFAQNSAICTSCAASTGVEGFGGGLMVYNTSVISTSTVFFDNFASLRGGAFYAAGDVPLTATVSAAYFFGNQISADSTFGGITAYIGGQATVYINNANETLDTSDGYQVVVADDAVFSLVITNPEGQQTGPCVFSGLAARGNAQVNVNCSMSIDNLDLEDQAGINLNTVASLSINKNIVWRGGGFKCTSLGSESNSIIYFRSSAKGTASLSNSRSKYLNACNFASTGTLLVQNFPGGQLTDLELYGHINPEIFNYGKLIFVGDVVLNNEGQVAASLQSDGEVRIESTLSLTGRSAPFNFIGVSTRNAAAPYFTIFLQNHNASFGTTDALQKSDTHIPTYTALKISGDFYPQGNFQVIVPDFWKGTWTSLVTYSSRSGKFLTKRILVPGDPDEEIPDYESYKMKVKYNSKSIDCSVAKSQSSMTGGQVFGVIFGVLLAVVLIAGIAFYFYRRQHGTTTFDGEVYETINQPRYGTTD